MNVVVTGGAGFIGSHVSERLLQEGHCVTIIDELNDFYDPAEKLTNLEAVRRSGSCEFYQLDIRDESAIGAVVTSAKPDLIIHLAGRAGVRPSLDDPLLYQDVNVRGTMVLLEAARQSGVPKFVFASSSSVYGITTQVPFREDDCSMMPISPYAATKIAGEKICFTYAHLYGISAVCLRLFTVYGPRQRPDLAIRRFIGLIQHGEQVPIFGDGSSGRDYTYIDDIVSGILAAAEYPCTYDIFNLGNSHPVRLDEMVSVLEEVLEIRSKRRMLPLQPGDVPITYADISKAVRVLDYRPSTSFRDGVANMVKWYRCGRMAGAQSASF